MSGIARTKVVGTVLTNDGDTAEVAFPNGDKRFFCRHDESQEAFIKEFRPNVKIGAAYCWAANVEDRESLFELFESVFGKPERRAMASTSWKCDEGALALVGQSRKFGNAEVFCSLECSHPDGGKGFAVVLPNRATTEELPGSPQWFHFNSSSEIEDALSLVAENCKPEFGERQTMNEAIARN